MRHEKGLSREEIKYFKSWMSESPLTTIIWSILHLRFSLRKVSFTYRMVMSCLLPINLSEAVPKTRLFSDSELKQSQDTRKRQSTILFLFPLFRLAALFPVLNLVSFLLCHLYCRCFRPLPHNQQLYLPSQNKEKSRNII